MAANKNTSIVNCSHLGPNQRLWRKGLVAEQVLAFFRLSRQCQFYVMFLKVPAVLFLMIFFYTERKDTDESLKMPLFGHILTSKIQVNQDKWIINSVIQNKVENLKFNFFSAPQRFNRHSEKWSGSKSTKEIKWIIF